MAMLDKNDPSVALGVSRQSQAEIQADPYDANSEIELFVVY